MLKRIIGKKINDTGRYAIKNDFIRRLISTIYHSSFFKKVTNRLDEMIDCKMLEEVKKYKLPEHIAII